MAVKKTYRNSKRRVELSDLFYEALMEQSQNGLQRKDLFRRIVFAIRSRGEESYNYKEFKRNF